MCVCVVYRVGFLLALYGIALVHVCITARFFDLLMPEDSGRQARFMGCKFAFDEGRLSA